MIKVHNAWIPWENVLADSGWYGMSLEEATKEFEAKGFVYHFVVRRHINSDVDYDFSAHRDFKKWSSFVTGIGPSDYYEVGYFFTDLTDAICARMIVQGD